MALAVSLLLNFPRPAAVLLILVFHTELWCCGASSHSSLGSGCHCVWQRQRCLVVWVDLHSRPGRDGCGKPHLWMGEGEEKKKKENSTRVILSQESPQQLSCWHYKKRKALLPVAIFSSHPVISEAAATIQKMDKKNNSTHCKQLHLRLSQSAPFRLSFHPEKKNEN